MTARPSTERQRSPYAVSLAACLVVVVAGLACVALAGGAYYLYTLRAAPAQPAVEYILDASPRMAQPAETDGGTRLAVAQGVLAEIVRPADQRTTAGLRVFGTGALPQACQDTRLVVPLAVAVQGQISSQLLGVASGLSPEAAVAEAMVSAIRDLRATRGPHSLVVVTGGDDSCTPEAGLLIAAEAERAGIRLQLFIVGYQVPDDQAEAIKGLVDDSGGGAYINTHTRAELEQVLKTIQQHLDDPVANPIAQVVATAQAATGPGGVFIAPTATGSLAQGTQAPPDSAQASATAALISTADAKVTADAKATSESLGTFAPGDGTAAGTSAAATAAAATAKATSGGGSVTQTGTPATPGAKITGSPTATSTRTATATPTFTRTASATPSVTPTATNKAATSTATRRPATSTFTPRPPTATFTQAPPTSTFTPIPAPTPFLNFGADNTSITAGQCTNLHWDSGNVQSVFLDGAGVEGAGTRNVCPSVSTPYNLLANFPGGQLNRQVSIFVTGPSGPPAINSVSRNVPDFFYEVAGCGPTEVTITADIAGADGAQLFYRVIPSGDPPTGWIAVPLQHPFPNTWIRVQHNFEMPAPLTGDVEYYVVANNAAGPSQSATFTGLNYSPCKP